MEVELSKQLLQQARKFQITRPSAKILYIEAVAGGFANST